MAGKLEVSWLCFNFPATKFSCQRIRIWTSDFFRHSLFVIRIFLDCAIFARAPSWLEQILRAFARACTHFPTKYALAQVVQGKGQHSVSPRGVAVF